MQLPDPLMNLHGTVTKPAMAATVQHMAGMLWYEMLSAMNQNGMDPNALGTGGGDFQSMFMWNLAQNDFGKYDSSLLKATLQQIGGSPAASPAPATQTPPTPLMPVSDTNPIIPPAAPIMVQSLPALLAPSANLPGNLLSVAKNFAKSVWPQITQAALSLGVPPVAVLAQTALETGWGTAVPGNNLFGIKAVDGEAGTQRATHEMVDGVLTAQTASFRDYNSTQDSVADYTGLIQSGYQGALGQNTVQGFATALQQGGYATDANYAAKIVNIANSPLMAQILQAIGGNISASSNISSNTGAP